MRGKLDSFRTTLKAMSHLLSLSVQYKRTLNIFEVARDSVMFKKNLQTRKHSSRMRTARLPTICVVAATRSVVGGGWVCLGG